MDNPFTLHTHKAAQVLGRLVRQWSTGEIAAPGVMQADGRTVLVDIEAFRKVLLAELRPEEFEIRNGVKELELLTRAPDKFSILLPEQEVLEHQSERARTGQPVVVNVGSVYADVSPGAPEGGQGAHAKAAPDNPAYPASYPVTLGKDAFDAFLDPYMGTYVTAQCG